jgi:hypothetical protein
MASPYESGPRKLNLVSFLFLVGAAFAVYAGVRFSPPYWTQWQLKEAMRDACSKMYSMQKHTADSKDKEMHELEEKLHKAIRDLGIDDPEATVELDDSDPEWNVVRASYTITVNHPIGKPTVMHFAPEVKMDTKPVDWDKK